MVKKFLLKTCIVTMLFFCCILFEKIALAEADKPITSWKNIVIGKTTEEEVIASNPEGTVYLSVQELPALSEGKPIIRTLTYGADRSYAEEKRKSDDYLSWANKEGGENLTKAVESLSPKPKIKDYLKPPLLNNGPIDLGWDKLGSAKLEITSNGKIMGWVMKYWFYDPGNPESFYAAFKDKRYPDKGEILEIFETEFGKPQKILKPESDSDIYIFIIDKRELTLKLTYRFENKVVYAQFGEGASKERWLVSKIIEAVAGMDESNTTK